MGFVLNCVEVFFCLVGVLLGIWLNGNRWKLFDWILFIGCCCCCCWKLFWYCKVCCWGICWEGLLNFGIFIVFCIWNVGWFCKGICDCWGVMDCMLFCLCFMAALGLDIGIEGIWFLFCMYICGLDDVLFWKRWKEVEVVGLFWKKFEALEEGICGKLGCERNLFCMVCEVGIIWDWIIFWDWVM